MGSPCRTQFRLKLMSSFLLPIAALLSVSAFGPAAYAQGVVGEFVPDVRIRSIRQLEPAAA